MQIIAEVPAGENYQEAEIGYIAYFRRNGKSLVNSVDGGHGARGLVWTIESRARLSSATKGREAIPSPKKLNYNGKSLTTPKWGRLLGLSRSAIRKRLRQGWTVERAVSVTNQSVKGGVQAKRVANTTTPEPILGARWLPLTKGKFALVDEADFSLVLKHSWHAQEVAGNNWYATTEINGRAVALHAFILGSSWVGHISLNGLDNRRVNLRIGSQEQNKKSRRLSKNNTTGYKGVRRVGKRWGARIGKNGALRLGCFDTVEEAAKVYDEAARRLYGEFARCNFNMAGV